MDYYKLNELPETYHRCKKYTAQFSDWLSKEAESRNIEILAPGGKQKSKYKIPVNSLVPLAQKIVQSGVPLEDESGLKDLSDAIRLRKEVNAWFGYHEKSDEGHPFIIAQLVKVKNLFWGFMKTKEHDLPVETTTIFLTPDKDRDHKDPFELEEDVSEEVQSETPDTSASLHKSAKKVPPPSAMKPNGIVLSKEQVSMEQEFQVLCFLYDFNSLRESVRQTWRDYKASEIGVVTAAIVTDLALGIIQRNVNALVEELNISNNESRLSEIVEKLYATLSFTKVFIPRTAEANDGLGHPSNPEFAQLFCIDAIQHMREYRRLKGAASTGTLANNYSEELIFMPFLLYFEQLRTEKITPPITDNFTKAMLASRTGTEPWLVYGLQIMMDVQHIVCSVFHDISREVIEGNIRTAELMRAHCEYEDIMWQAGSKPDYFVVGETKFSNNFLQPSGVVLEWLKQIIDEEGAVEAPGLTAFQFVSIHPVLSGLVVYHFHKIYQTNSIEKTEWFIVAFCHLYNACRQIGGLSIDWPDLEYIIAVHGNKRIFVGSRPTDPQDFYHRLLVATGIGSQSFAPDRWNRSRVKSGGIISERIRTLTWLRASERIRAKRGLLSHFPLQEIIRDYYRNNRPNDRWIHLHNLFAYVFNTKTDSEPADKRPVKALRANFAAAIALLYPNKARNNRRNKSQVKCPNFASMECVHAGLLVEVKNKLRDSEHHSQFDYLSLYRRLFNLVLHIRDDVLFDESMELAKINLGEEAPGNFQLLADLFKELQIKPKDPKIKTRGDEVSKDVVALQQLQKISAMMGQMIELEGYDELEKAQSLLRRPQDPTEYDATGPNLTEPALPETELTKPDLTDFGHTEPGPTEPASNRVALAVPDSIVLDPAELVSSSTCGIRGTKALYHRITYASTVSRKRHVASARCQHCSQFHLAHKPSRVGFYHRLVGKKKRSVAFPCLGVCCLARIYLGKDSEVKQVGKIHPSVWEDLTHEDWETDTEPSESEWIDAVEYQQ